MRVTAKVKQQTRERILESARNLFKEKGFDETTTRDIAAASKIAAGTLFNYFATKEALAMAIIGGCFDSASEEFQARLRGNEELDERLFAHVTASMRHLTPHRRYVVRLLEGSIHLIEETPGTDPASGRGAHLATVRSLLTSNGAGPADEPSVVTMHLYWTLFLGVLAYWAADESEFQEDTLVLLDQSMKLFVNSLDLNQNAGGR